MTKARDAAHDSGAGDEKLDQRARKKVDLHRYQVMTIPLDLQQELASLKGPRLSDEDMKPLPPIEDVVKARQGSSSRPPAVVSKVLQFFAAHRVVLLGATAMVFALAWLFARLAGNDPQLPTKIVEPGQTNGAPVPAGRKEPVQQPAQPATAPSLANTSTHSADSEASAVKLPAAAPSSQPVDSRGQLKAVVPSKSAAATSATPEASKPPPRRAAFKPE